MKTVITKSAARRFLLRKQLLFPSRSLQGTDAVNAVFQKLRLIQYDPLNPCGRNVDIVLQSRIRDYHANDYYQWLYKERKGIECYDKELCVIPIEDFYLMGPRRHKALRHKRTEKFLQRYRVEVERLMQTVQANGPLASSDIQTKIYVQGGWSDRVRFGRIGLETMWKIGKLVVVKRDNGKKYYDIAKKVYGENFAYETPSDRLLKEHIIRRVKSVGILPVAGTGGGWLGLGTGREIRPIIQDTIHSRELTEVSVAGIKNIYVIATDDLFELSQLAHVENMHMTFLAPLDNLLWDRVMIKNIFGFNYTWEVYTPIHKRKYGYYVLPILYGDRFVGRIEPVLDKEKNLVIKNIWMEEGIIWDHAIRKAYDEALVYFGDYVGAEKLVIAKGR